MKLTNRRLAVSPKRGTSVTLEHEKRKKSKASIERPPVAVPEAVRNRPTPQSAPYKAVLECVRNTGLLSPEATPLQERPTWLGPPSTPPPEVRDTPGSDHSFHGIKESSRDFDAIH